MRRTFRYVEIFVRVFLASMLFGMTLIPTPAVAAEFADTWESEEPDIKESLSPNYQPLTELPSQTPRYYQPPYDESGVGLERNPDRTDIPSRVPQKVKKQIEFVLTSDKSSIAVNGEVEIFVSVTNDSSAMLDSSVYIDELESGFTFIGTEDDVSYDALTGEVSLIVPSIAIGETYSFSYMLKAIAVSGSQGNHGKLWIHQASYSDLSETIKIRVGGSNQEEIDVFGEAKSNQGWMSLGDVSLNFGEGAVNDNTIVGFTLLPDNATGPEKQFQIELFETEPIIHSSKNGEKITKEQKVSINNQTDGVLNSRVFMSVNFDGVVDLANIPAGQSPYVATYDEGNDVWVKVPILEIDEANNSVIIETQHFSVWGAGLGGGLPQNGANVLLFDQPYVSLFSGGSRYGVPIWMPPGRNGMTPSLNLAYSSGSLNGVLGDVQTSWVGAGWNLDGIEIVRKITTDENGYGYENEFALTLNGVYYELIRDEADPVHYFTKTGSFLYIERHNFAFGNAGDVDNTGGEWWEVVATDGTRYRLGYHEDSEQMALMYGYSCTQGSVCNTPDAPYDVSGYAGVVGDMVAFRWRVDKISDTHGNYIEYQYQESQPPIASLISQFDLSSYVSSIAYTGFDNGSPAQDVAPGYQIVFNRIARPVEQIPTEFYIFDHYDEEHLSSIEIVQCKDACDGWTASGGTGDLTVRTYSFEYGQASHTYGSEDPNYVLTLDSILIVGEEITENIGGTNIFIDATTAGKVSFTYTQMPNRDDGGENTWDYPRLTSIDNGYGGSLVYTYGDDGRDSTTWYNYRVEHVEVKDGLGGNAAYQAYTYESPQYASNELLGYQTVNEFTKSLDGINEISKVEHTFGISGLDVGRTLETKWIDPVSSTIMRKVVNQYITDNRQAPFEGWNYRYLAITEHYELSGGALTLIGKQEFLRDEGNGNLIVQKDYDGGGALYRKQYYEYVTNADPAVHILDKVSRTITVDTNNLIFSESYYKYDNNQGTLDYGNLGLVRQITGIGDQTIDTEFEYDDYGNLIKSIVYTGYGTLGSYQGEFDPRQITTTEYGDINKTYPTKLTNALNESAQTVYFTSLGVPYQVTDANGWVSTTEYDSLGRVLKVFAPGVEYQGSPQAGMIYDYPDLNGNDTVDAPYSIHMQIWDEQKVWIDGEGVEQIGGTRSVWGIYDGLGRMLQNQVYDADSGKTLLSDTLYNDQGTIHKKGSPDGLAVSGGAYQTPDWETFPYSEVGYDALGRAIITTAPGGHVTQTIYDGLTTTMVNANGQKVARVMDSFGRLVSIAEYQDSSTIYAVTNYQYNLVDSLLKVTDALANQTTITYDLVGRKLGMQDPDMGLWGYQYDATGNLISQTDARGQVLGFQYDELNRLTIKTDESLSQQISINAYGSLVGELGFRTSMSDASGSTSWSFSNYGRTVTEAKTITGLTVQSFTTNTDWLGRVTTISYPDADTVTYTYDALGRPKNFTSSEQGAVLLAELAYTELGQLATIELGNDAVISNSYETAGTDIFRLENINVFKGTDLLDFDYFYDAVGNITQIIDTVLGESIVYTYDFLNRLTSADADIGAVNSYSQVFEYDQVGNILDVQDWDAGEVIFKDDFESGDIFEWSSFVTDGGDLLISSVTARTGTYSMLATIDDTNPIYVEDISPDDLNHYRARFYIDVTNLVMADGDIFTVFEGNDATVNVIEIKILYSQGEYFVNIGSKDDASQYEESFWVKIISDWVSVELDWKGATSLGANDGSTRLWVSGNLAYENIVLDNDTYLIDNVRFGAVSGIDSGTSGSISLDTFESREYSYMGAIEGDASNPLQYKSVFIESNGEVVFEAENYHSSELGTGVASGSSWNLDTQYSGYVGSGYMQAVPNTGVNTGLTLDGPALLYDILFDSPGTYYVYIRGRGIATNIDDSIQVGIDNVSTTNSSGYGLTYFTLNEFTWQNHYDGNDATIYIPEAGIYTFYMWMREDGVNIDRIRLSTTQDAVSNGNTSFGPSESQMTSIWDKSHQLVDLELEYYVVAPKVLLQPASNNINPIPQFVAVNPGTTNLVSWWNLDETSGIRYDSHGSNNLTDNNTVLSGTGKQGNAAIFNVSNSESLTIADNASLSFTDVELTVSAWIKFDSKTSVYKGIVSKYDYGASSREFSISYNSTEDRLTFVVSNDGSTRDKAVANNLGSPVVGTWYFVVGWHDPVTNTLNIQVNNGTIDSKAWTTGIFNGSAKLSFGGLTYNGTPSDFFDGLIDEVAIFDDILTPDERTWLYNSGLGRSYSEVNPPTPTATPTSTPTNTPGPSPTPTATSIPTPSGGTITYDGPYTVHTFTEDGTFDTNGLDIYSLDLLIMAGGGAGGAGSSNGGGGGGGCGGHIYLQNYNLANGIYPVVVGDGGLGQTNSYGLNGENSSIYGNVAIGGGGGGRVGSSTHRSGKDGGCGGGGAARDGQPEESEWGFGISGQGKNGGYGHSGDGGGGGGGIGTVGSHGWVPPNDGGDGLQFDITGTLLYYGGGGGGGDDGIGSSGGLGGGGGSASGTSTGDAGTDGLGGGGGAGDANNSIGGRGGSGIVIIRYLTNLPTPTPTFTPTPTNTAGPSPTPTSTFTSTPTNTATNTPTPTSTATPILNDIQFESVSHFKGNKYWQCDPISFSHTTSGVNRIIVLQVYASRNNENMTATFAGVPMIKANAGSNNNLIFYLANPPLGTNNVTVDPGLCSKMVGVASTYSGIDINNPVAHASSTGMVNYMPVHSEQLIVGHAGKNDNDGDSSFSASGDQTVRDQYNDTKNPSNNVVVAILVSDESSSGIEEHKYSLSSADGGGSSAIILNPLNYFGTPPPAPTQIPNLIGYWDMSSSNGLTVRDDSGHGNDGILFGPTLSVGGIVDNALSFDGVNDYVLIYNPRSHKPSNNISLSAWIYPITAGDGSIQTIANKGGATKEYALLLNEEGHLQFYLSDLSPNYIEGPKPPLNTWTHVTGVFNNDDDILQLFVNGILVTTIGVSGNISYNDDDYLRISDSSQPWDGLLNEIRLYDKALTTSDVAGIYSAIPISTPTATSTISATQTPSATPTPVPGSDDPWGTGLDGNLTVAVSTTFNLNSSMSNGRTCADGKSYAVTQLVSNAATLSSSLSSDCLTAGDEVMIINVQGSTISTANVGNYEFLRVLSIDTVNDKVTFVGIKSKSYGEGFLSDSNIGTGTDQQKVLLVRVPNYNNVTVEGTLTGSGWNGTNYGVVVIRAFGTISGAGKIHANGKGIEGGNGGNGTKTIPCTGCEGGIKKIGNGGKTGEGIGPIGVGGGNGGSGETCNTTPTGYLYPSKSGGDGIFATGNNRYGEETLLQLFLGSGGGGGGAGCETNEYGRVGGNGAGVLFLAGNIINFTGQIEARGNEGVGGSGAGRGGGNGSGGSIRIEGNTIDLSLASININGYDSNGGIGRFAIYYETSIVQPAPALAYVAVLGAPPPTPMPPTPAPATPSPWGDGHDGDLDILVGTTFNIQSETQNTERLCTQGGDGLSYQVNSLTSLSATINTSPTDDCLLPDDEILIINLQGDANNYDNVGNYEFLHVRDIVGNVIYFTEQKTVFFGASAGLDDGLGTGTAQNVMLIRVPNYQNVNIDGKIKANGFDDSINGLLVFKVAGELTGTGTMDMIGKGYLRGGSGWGSKHGQTFNNGGYLFGAGEGHMGIHAYGGGAGYGTEGEKDPRNWAIDGRGGLPYGDAAITQLYLGAGGGKYYIGYSGNDGGGSIFILAETINFSGVIINRGECNYRGGGGVAGSVKILGDVVNIGTVDILPNSGSFCWVPSGLGRYALYYETSATYGTVPGYLENLTTGQVIIDDIFSDTFDSNTFVFWEDDPLIDFGDLSTSNEAAYRGGYGLLANIDDQNNLVIVDDTPEAEKRYRARFYLDPTNLVMTAGDELLIFSADDSTTDVLQIWLRNIAGVYEIEIRVLNDGGVTWTNSGWFALSSGWNAIEIDWYAAVMTGFANGTITLWINGTEEYSIATIDNDTYTIESVQLGARFVDVGTNGQLYFDDFASTRMSYIGTLAAPPTPPEAVIQPGWLGATYNYDAAQPHAVTSVEREQVSGGTTTDTYTYDENGNMVTRYEDGVTYFHSYNAENRLSEIQLSVIGIIDDLSNEYWYFTYDGDGTRVKEVYTDGVTTITKYFFGGGSYEVTDTDTVVTTKKYYSIAGKRIAVDDGIDLNYMASDYLGSSSIMMDSNGLLLSSQRYMPFGQVRTDDAGIDVLKTLMPLNGETISETDFGYTGQRNYSGFGLMDYNARFYSPLLGRFTQPDTIVPGKSSQSFNRYSYTLNNPINNSDPNGHCNFILILLGVCTEAENSVIDVDESDDITETPYISTPTETPHPESPTPIHSPTIITATTFNETSTLFPTETATFALPFSTSTPSPTSWISTPAIGYTPSGGSIFDPIFGAVGEFVQEHSYIDLPDEPWYPLDPLGPMYDVIDQVGMSFGIPALGKTIKVTIETVATAIDFLGISVKILDKLNNYRDFSPYGIPYGVYPE